MHLLIAILAAIIAANLEAISEICQRQADLLVHAGAWRRDRGIRSGDDSPRAAVLRNHPSDHQNIRPHRLAKLRDRCCSANASGPRFVPLTRTFSRVLQLHFANSGRRLFLAKLLLWTEWLVATPACSVILGQCQVDGVKICNVRCSIAPRSGWRTRRM